MSQLAHHKLSHLLLRHVYEALFCLANLPLPLHSLSLSRLNCILGIAQVLALEHPGCRHLHATVRLDGVEADLSHQTIRRFIVLVQARLTVGDELFQLRNLLVLRLQLLLQAVYLLLAELLH